MKFYSPLRYPGGKNRLAKFMALVCKENNINSVDGHYVEPYAGGASVALALLMDGHVSRVTINDVDRSIYAFWYSVRNKTDELCELIRATSIDLENREIQKGVQRRKKSANLLELGFSTFFLNRTNFSGIINGGVLGGVNQDGKYKIDCRFNKEDLIRRIKEIAQYKSKIKIRHMDALNLIRYIQEKPADGQTIFYFDPPYYLKGESLYMNHYKHEDHEEVSRKIQNIKGAHWIVSYDNTPEIRKMYRRCQKIIYSLAHTAHSAKLGQEAVFSSKGLKMPKVPNPAKISPKQFAELSTA